MAKVGEPCNVDAHAKILASWLVGIGWFDLPISDMWNLWIGVGIHQHCQNKSTMLQNLTPLCLAERGKKVNT